MEENGRVAPSLIKAAAGAWQESPWEKLSPQSSGSQLREGFEWDHEMSGWPRSLGLGRTQELALSPHKCGDISATSLSKALGWASSKPQDASPSSATARPARRLASRTLSPPDSKLETQEGPAGSRACPAPLPRCTAAAPEPRRPRVMTRFLPSRRARAVRSRSPSALVPRLEPAAAAAAEAAAGAERSPGARGVAGCTPVQALCSETVNASAASQPAPESGFLAVGSRSPPGLPLGFR
ncbi:brain acid soluble protein 1-like [Phocoena sinus]|uniref:brain acid soluble protein 1-like n=1 Tax=Phocoena sinus TaxID=42100 RepID=UPI0013C45879|nr:brain acid soluble protein 1-like [Phocoena sinus]